MARFYRNLLERGLRPAAALRRAVEGSLARLRTDRIDLYQFHWPNRGSYHFRQNWAFDPSRQNRAATRAHMVEALETLAALVENERAIRHRYRGQVFWEYAGGSFGRRAGAYHQ